MLAYDELTRPDPVVWATASECCAASGEGELLINRAAQSAGTAEGKFQGPGVFIGTAADAAFSKRFAEAIAQHRFAERLDIDNIVA